MINRTIHQVWIGSLPKPKKWLSTWPAKNPTWEYKLWGNDEIFTRGWYNQHLIDELVRRYNEEIKGKGNLGSDVFVNARGKRYVGERATLYAWHIIADLVRYEILYEYGGYMPGADSVCLRSINDKFDPNTTLYTLRTGNMHAERLKALEFATKGKVPTAKQKLLMERYAPENASPILAAEQGHWFLKACIDELHQIKPENLGEAVDTTGNVFMGKMLRKYKPDIVMPDYTKRSDRVANGDYSMHYAGTTRNNYDQGR